MSPAFRNEGQVAMMKLSQEISGRVERTTIFEVTLNTDATNR